MHPSDPRPRHLAAKQGPRQTFEQTLKQAGVKAVPFPRAPVVPIVVAFGLLLGTAVSLSSTVMLGAPV